MSRSKHQKVKGVFGGRSKGEVNAMIAEGDEDVTELVPKGRLKRVARDRRSDQEP